MADEVIPLGVGPALGAAGPCPTVTHGDKVWKVGHPTQRAKATLELLVLETAAKNIEEAKGALPPARWEAKNAKLDADIDAGQYRTWGTLWRTVYGGPDGQALALTSLLRENHPEATVADGLLLWRAETKQVARAMRIVTPDFFAVLATTLPGSSEEQRAEVADALAAVLEGLATLAGATPPS